MNLRLINIRFRFTMLLISARIGWMAFGSTFNE